MNVLPPPRILLIEDDAVTARLLSRKLEAAGYAVVYLRDSDLAVSRLQTEAFDLLTLDYSLPGRTGLEVIQLLASRGISIPIIMVTGSGDERIAVEAMKLGAKDYIVKDDEGRYLELLPKVVERILAERDLLREKQQAIEALTETRARYQALFENTPLGIYRTTPDGQFIDANPALIQMLGLPEKAGLLEMKLIDFFRDPLDMSRWKEMMEKENAVVNYEAEFLRADGQPIWVENNSRAIRDASGKILYYEGSLQNITERKKTEEDFRRMLVANSTIAEMSKALLAPGSIKSISQLVLEKAKSLTGSRIGYVSYIDPSTGHLICAAMSPEFIELFQLKENEDLAQKITGLWRWSLDKKRPLLTNSAAEDARFAASERAQVTVQRVLSVPVLFGEKLVGQISVANAGRNYTELDLSTLGSLASAYAVSLERKWTEDAIVRARDFYTTILEEFPTLIWRSGLDGRLDYFNKTWLSFTGRSLQEELGQGWLDDIHPEDVQSVAQAYRRAFQTRRAFEIEFRLRRYDGVYRWVMDNGRPFFDLEGKFAGFIGSCLDITEQKEVEEKLREMSHHDGLTQLFNRSFFEEELARIERGRNYPVTIIMVDVDELKKTNDTLGHAEGDKLLLRAAEVLRLTFRPEDIVARIGGDEFAAILPGVNEAGASSVVGRLRNRLEEHNKSYPDQPLKLSVGAATVDRGTRLSVGLADADERMYQEKLTKAQASGRRPA